MADYSSRRVSDTPVATKFERERVVVFVDTLAFDALTVATKFLRGDESARYSMRARHTVLNQYVYWDVLDFPDYAGQYSGHSPGDLAGIIVTRRVQL